MHMGSKSNAPYYTAAWKLWEYGDWPSPDTFFWLDYGYDHYNQWEESQAR